jgi:hypothetical protein
MRRERIAVIVTGLQVGKSKTVHLSRWPWSECGQVNYVNNGWVNAHYNQFDNYVKPQRVRRRPLHEVNCRACLRTHLAYSFYMHNSLDYNAYRDANKRVS